MMHIDMRVIQEFAGNVYVNLKIPYYRSHPFHALVVYIDVSRVTTTSRSHASILSWLVRGLWYLPRLCQSFR